MNIVLLLLLGLTLIAAASGESVCLTPGHAEYKCDATQLYDSRLGIYLRSCDITDDDVEALTACLVVAGALDPPPTNLWLDNNMLATLPPDLFEPLGALEELNLFGNNLATLPEGIFDPLGSLTYLYLNRNMFETLPAGIFGPLGKLDHLYLGESRLKTLPPGIFQPLGVLKYLDLTYNEFETLSVGTFEGLGSLTNLYIWHNMLKTLPADIFAPLGELYELSLQHNNLASLPAGIFDPMGSLQHLFVHDNPLECRPTSSATNYLGGVDGGICGCTLADDEPVPCDGSCAPGEFGYECGAGSTCSNGVLGIDGSNSKGDRVCCPIECNRCGGPGCRKFGAAAGLGGEACCVNGVVKSSGPCSETGSAPCVV